jgi:hypothetical protein
VNKKMKSLIYIIIVLLVGCEGKSSTGSLEEHVKDKRREIEVALDEFERSGYKKVSFGPPNFLTFVNPDGNTKEVSANMGVVAEEQNGNSALEMDAARYVKVFREADIRCIEKSIGLYVDFPDGGRLLIFKDDAKTASQLLRGKASVEVYPGWYTLVE